MRIVALIALLPTAAGAAGSIEGSVTDDGKAIAGALVAAIDPHASESPLTARTDAQGRFRIGALKPIHYGVTATAPGHTAGLALGVAVSDGVATHVDVKLGGEAIKVDGVILDDIDRRPLAGATLLARRNSDVEGDVFVVDVHDGRYGVMLPRASYEFVVRATGHADANQAVSNTPTASLTHWLSRAWPPGAPPAAVVDWLRHNAVPLSTVEPNHGSDDLRPLANAIGDARIVGLGEATHGTREFFLLKHRLLEWLVAERGFSIFAIEIGLPDAVDINEYVVTGRGDPRKALAGLGGWVWDTEEVLDMIRWMRRWNEDPSHRRLKVYGFDMQSPARAAKVALAYVAKVAPNEARALSMPLAALTNALDAEAATTTSEAEKRALMSGALALLDRFDAARAEWIARSSNGAWEVARQHARVLIQCLSASAGSTFDGDVRERATAENISWIADHEGPDAKIAVWAHDGHVSHGTTGWHPMGHYLTKRWGKAYVNVGFAFDHGSFRARDPEDDFQLHSFTVASLPAGTFDATLAATGLPRFVVDLRGRPASGVIQDWLVAQHRKRDPGSVYSPKMTRTANGNPTVVVQEFDLIAFIAETTASRGLPEGNGGDRRVQPEARNFEFEEHDDGKPRDWTASPQLAAFGYELQSSTENPFRGTRCALVRRLRGPRYGEAVGRFQQRIDAKPYRGKRVRLTGIVRAMVRQDGNARLLLEAEQPSGSVGVARTMREQPIVDSRWRSYAIEIDVPPTARALVAGGALVGDGSACFDSFKLDVLN